MPDADPDAGSQQSGRGGFLTFWTTLPGILTGCAALLTAIAGLMTLLNDSPANPEDPGVGSTVTAAETSRASRVPAARDGSAESSPGGSNAIAAPPGVLVQGQISMRSPESADLESGLVGAGPNGLDLYLHCSGIACILNPMRSLVAVADSTGDRAACIEALSRRRDGALELQEFSVGQELCIQTEEGHLGRMQMLELPGVGSVDFVFSYTLWR